VSSEVDADLEALILKATANRPDDRYSSAAALADDIDRYLKGDPLTAQRPTVTYLLRKKLIRHRVPISVATAVIVGIVAMAVYSSIRITRERDMAIAATDAESHERNVAIEAANAENALRHVSDRRLADSLILIADDDEHQKRWHDAGEQFWEARKIQLAEGVSAINAELGLLEATRHSPNELTRFSAEGQWPFVPVGVSFDSDGQTVWAQMPNGIVQVYDPLTGRLIRSIGHTVTDGQVYSVFDCQGSHLFYRLVVRHDSDGLFASDIEEVNLLDGEVRRSLTFAGALSSWAAVSPNGQSVVGPGRLDASSRYRSQWNLWLVDATNQTEPHILSEHAEQLRAVSWSPDMKTIVTGDDQGHLRLWDAVTRTEKHYPNWGIGVPGSPASFDISILKYSPDGSGLLVSDRSGNVGFLALSPTLQSRRFETSDGLVRALAFSSDGRLALSGDTVGTVCLWDVSSGELLRTFSVGAPIASLRFSPDDRTVLTSDTNGSVALWPVDLADPAVLFHCATRASCLAVSPDGLLAAVGISHEAKIIDVATGRQLWSFTLPANVTAVAFAASGSTVDIGTSDGGISRFEVFGGWRRVCGCDPDATLGGIASVAKIPMAKRLTTVYLAASSNCGFCLTNECAIVMDIAKGCRLRAMDGTFVLLGCISADGRKAIAIAARQRRIMEVFDLEKDANAEIPLEQYPFAQAVAISPDSSTAFVAYNDSTIQAIDLANWKQKWTVSSHQQIIKSLVVSPVGTTILSASADGTLRLWSTADGRELRCLAAGLNPISATAFSLRGDLILSNGAAQNGICVWDLTLPQRIRESKDTAIKAWQALAEGQASTAAMKSVIEWYGLQGRWDWAGKLLDQTHGDASMGLEAARCRWQSNENAAAATDFASLLQSQTGADHFPQGYLRACRDAALQH
jgi:WD40 repeat protein